MTSLTEIPSIFDSIKNLNVEEVQQYLSDKTENEIESCIYERRFMGKQNLIEFIFSELVGVGGRTEINRIAFITMRESNPYRTKRDIELTIKVEKIIELIVSKCPSLIQEKQFTALNHYKCLNLIKIFTNYYVCKDTTESCFICLCDYTNQLIKSTCVCNSKIHLTCLIETVKKCGEKCSVCNTSYYPYGISKFIAFPKANIYPSPLMSNYLLLDSANKNECLHFAVAFLCCERVETILSGMNNEEYDDYKKKTDYYALHELVDNKIKLKNMPYTNLSRDRYANKFNRIEYLFEQKEQMLLAVEK